MIQNKIIQYLLLRNIFVFLFFLNRVITLMLLRTKLSPKSFLSFYIVFIVNFKDTQGHWSKLYLLHIILKNIVGVCCASACGWPLCCLGGMWGAVWRPNVAFRDVFWMFSSVLNPIRLHMSQDSWRFGSNFHFPSSSLSPHLNFHTSSLKIQK